jgi:hypothetical protein
MFDTNTAGAEGKAPKNEISWNSSSAGMRLIPAWIIFPLDVVKTPCFMAIHGTFSVMGDVASGASAISVTMVTTHFLSSLACAPHSFQASSADSSKT